MLGKFLGLSVLQFVHLQNGQNDIPFLMGSLGRLNKLIASPQHSAGMGYTLVSPPALARGGGMTGLLHVSSQSKDEH